MDNNQHSEESSEKVSSQSPTAGGQIMDITSPQQVNGAFPGTENPTSNLSSSSDKTSESPANSFESSQPDGATSDSVEPTDSSENAEVESSGQNEEPTENNSDVSSQFETTNESSFSSPSVSQTETVPETVPASIEPSQRTEESSENMSAVPESISHPTPTPHVDAPKQRNHHKTPIVAIFIAITLAILLAGLVVFAYLKNNRNGNIQRSDNTTSSNAIPAPTVSAVTGNDVNSTSNSIDTSLKKANDSTDFADTTLSDTTLGL